MQLSHSNSNLFQTFQKTTTVKNSVLLLKFLALFITVCVTPIDLPIAYADESFPSEDTKAKDFFVTSEQVGYNLILELSAPDGFHFNVSAPHQVLLGLEGEESHSMKELVLKAGTKSGTPKNSKTKNLNASQLRFSHDTRKKMAITHFLAQAYLCDAANTICEQHSVEGALHAVKKKALRQTKRR